MQDPVQLMFLIAIIAAFAAFAVTLFGVSIWVQIARRPEAEPLPRRVTPAQSASGATPLPLT
jgi:hypothetical protein